MKRTAYSLVFVCLLGTLALGQDKAKVSVVDSGTFAIVANGSRVATEIFKVEQRGASSFVTSELRLDDGKNKASQTAELETTANGMLKRYVWKEIKPGDAQIVVQPQDDQFLAVHISESGTAPAKDMTHALSPVTSILDDNFFSQMQVLAWKYMASGCKPAANGQNECVWEKRQLPILNPHQQESLLVSMEFVGLQNVRFKGEDRSLKAFKLRGEAGEWLLWFNDDNKLVRVLIPADNTEVIRD